MKLYTKAEVLNEIKRHAVACMNGDEFTPMADVLRYLSNRYKIPVPTLKKYFYPSKAFNPTGINSQLLKAAGFECFYVKTDREERETKETAPKRTKETPRKHTAEHKGENKKHAESQEKKEKILLAFKEFLESVS